MTAPPYTIDTVEGTDGTEHPSEHLWNPADDDAKEHSFLRHDGMLLTAVGPEDEPPTAFVALGHGHTWTALCDAAAAYMRHVWTSDDLYSYPGDQPPAVAPRMPLPERTHAVFLRHPHPEHPFGCAWTTPGASSTRPPPNPAPSPWPEAERAVAYRQNRGAYAPADTVTQ